MFGVKYRVEEDYRLEGFQETLGETGLEMVNHLKGVLLLWKDGTFEDIRLR